ncbi:unnamed protein product [Paramecium octaurelia]|uniref:Uncharacterized protein n=1 Tax=Paramecium octaurelia TaxID=43137 RepID=A0A8S1SI45_PAROT|nr:unnamed protein product [Paramecium octaurelia]
MTQKMKNGHNTDFLIPRQVLEYNLQINNLRQYIPIIILQLKHLLYNQCRMHQFQLNIKNKMFQWVRCNGPLKNFKKAT